MRRLIPIHRIWNDAWNKIWLHYENYWSYLRFQKESKKFKFFVGSKIILCYSSEIKRRKCYKNYVCIENQLIFNVFFKGRTRKCARRGVATAALIPALTLKSNDLEFPRRRRKEKLNQGRPSERGTHSLGTHRGPGVYGHETLDHVFVTEQKFTIQECNRIKG